MMTDSTRRQEQDAEIAAIVGRNPLAAYRYYFQLQYDEKGNASLWSARCGHIIPYQRDPVRVDDCPKCDPLMRPNIAWDLHVAAGGD